MRTKPLSERAGFRSAIVLRAPMLTARGGGGMNEFAMRLTRKALEFWNWASEYGAERVVALPPTTTWREAVRQMVTIDVVPAAVNPNDVEIFGDRPPVGDILALAWSTNENDQMAALVLSQFDDKSLALLAADRRSLRSSDLRAVLDDVIKTMRHAFVEAAEIELVTVRRQGVKPLRATFRSAIAQSLKKRRASERAKANALAPFKPQIDMIIERWRAGRPNSHYPGLGNVVPPRGLGPLRDYLVSYVSRHAALPSGAHTIPAGPDGLRGNSPAFDVNFDEMAR